MVPAWTPVVCYKLVLCCDYTSLSSPETADTDGSAGKGWKVSQVSQGLSAHFEVDTPLLPPPADSLLPDEEIGRAEVRWPMLCCAV